MAQNLAAWTVAGTLAYYLWVKPEQKAEAERRVGALGFAIDMFIRARVAAYCHDLQWMRVLARRLTVQVSAQAARERIAKYAKEKGIEDVDRIRPTGGAPVGDWRLECCARTCRSQRTS